MAAPLRPVGALWALLSLALGVTQLFVLFQPGWLVRPATVGLLQPFDDSRLLFDTFPTVKGVDMLVIQQKDVEKMTAMGYTLSFGPVVRCYEKERLHFTLCRPYLTSESWPNIRHRLHIPTAHWTGLFCLYGLGAVFVLAAGAIGAVALPMESDRHEMVVDAAGKLQIVAVSLQSIGLLLAVFPTQYTSTPLFQCQSSHPCRLGWAGALAASAALLAALCPLLARHTGYGATNTLTGAPVQIYAFDERPPNAFDEDESRTKRRDDDTAGRSREWLLI